MPTYINRGTFLKLNDNTHSLLSIIQTLSSVLPAVFTIRTKNLEPSLLISTIKIYPEDCNQDKN